MSDIDRVFARFQDTRTPASDRREVRTVPGRGTRGSRVVEVVHRRSGAPAAAAESPRQTRANLRAASWEEGFPARQAPQPPAVEPPPVVVAPEPTAHVLPAWEPVAPAPEAVPAAPAPRAPRAQRVAARAMERAVADPFDATDERANCLRCGYLVEPQREARGLMTCAACG